MKRNTLLNKAKYLILCIFLIPVTTSVASAATYYVNASCATSGNGTTPTCGSNGPWKTLAEAASGVPSNANHTISVAAGTYNETITDSRSGVSPGYRHWLANGSVYLTSAVLNGNWIKFEGFRSNNCPNIDNTATIRINGSNVYVKNNTITNTAVRGIMIWNASSNGCIIENNTIATMYGAGLVITGTNHQILNNDLSDIRQGQYDSNFVEFFGSGHIFRGNYFHNFIKANNPSQPHADCFQWWDNAGTPQEAPHNVIIERNHIFMGVDATGQLEQSWTSVNTISAFMAGGDEGGGRYSDNIVIRNNLIEACNGYKTGGAGGSYYVRNIKIYNNTFRSDISFSSSVYPVAIYIQGTSGAEIYNNITTNFNFREVWLEHSYAGVVGDYNLFWRSSGSVAFDNYPLNAHDKTNSNPLFVNNYGDLHLQSSSPARDAGTTISTVTNDYGGISRPQGGAYDIGAFEYTGSDTSSPSPPVGLRVISQN